MNYSRLVICLVILLSLGLNLSALEIGSSFRIGNLSLNQMTSPALTAFNSLDFSSWGLSAWLTHHISDNFIMEAGFFSDPILHNIAYTLFSYTESFFKIGVGPYFGFFNAEWDQVFKAGILKPGISTNIKLEIPAVFYLDFRTDRSLASRLVIPGDYIQERTDISFGFYVRNAICSVNFFSRKFTRKEIISESLEFEVINSLNEYSFISNLYQKNVPYRITLKLAYQVLSKSFSDATADTLYVLNSIIVGTKMEFDISEAMFLYLDLDSSVYSFAQEELSSFAFENYLFRGSAGIEINLARLQANHSIDGEIVEF